MAKYRDYPYQSVLAPYIKEYIAEKRSLGFIYDVKGYQLYRFDQYWIKNAFDDVHLTPERLEKWVCALPGESKSSQTSRIGAAKDLAIYMNTLGIQCHVPLLSVGSDQRQIHLLDKTEINELFNAVDTYVPHSINLSDYRMADEYPIMFRLYYCCGMRNNEVCSLKTSDVDLKKGIITVYGGKNNKDRLVYLPDDLCRLADMYFGLLKRTLGYEPYWFFPGRYPNKHMQKTSIDRKFREFWHMTASSKHCDKDPTPHSLRHSFVVDRINKWILEGIDINVMFIYLSKYLGHKNPDESFYYYHLAKDAFRIIRQKDTMSGDVIPEVRRR
ncbi:tyrosine-type recombinase/integrase [Oribacterium sp. FC2011]|uniref:tyrosine-type recombinase/integrase n=1 Tax=Oribacterium sp. FC2011 TaxID=1408311 RepID=UPI0004E0D41E|nr:tyrosine-type recombinase/integrase [Oribacterium sp. FC2011]